MASVCDPVRACDLRHKISIQRANPTADDGGGHTDPWENPTTVATARACIEPLKGDERLKAMQLEDKVSHKITLRYQAGISAQHRVLFGGRVFNIRAVVNLEERNRWLQIFAEEGVAT